MVKSGNQRSEQLDHAINHKRIYRLMKLTGIQSVIRSKKKKYVKSTPEQLSENVLNRRFTAEKSNEKWVTDVTEMKYGREQKAYLRAILDLHDNPLWPTSLVIQIAIASFSQYWTWLSKLHPEHRQCFA